MTVAPQPVTPAPVVVETKSALQTTEFWTSMGIHLIMFLNLIGVWNYMPNKYSAITMAVVQGLYAISRGVAKAGVAFQKSP